MKLELDPTVKALFLERVSLFLVVCALTFAAGIEIAITYKHILTAVAHSVIVFFDSFSTM